MVPRERKKIPPLTLHININMLCVGVEEGCEIVGGHMANDMLFDDFLTLPTFRNLVFLRPARVN